MRPGVRRPHEIIITERVDSGLPPLSDAVIFESREEDISDDSAESEESPIPEADDVVDSVVEMMSDIESEQEEE